MSEGAQVPAALSAWAAQRREEVLRQAEDLIVRHARTSEQRALLGASLVALRAHAARAEVLPFVHLPLLVYAGVRGDDTPAIPLATATALQSQGVALFDDLGRGELPEQWAGRPAAEAHLAAAALVSALPQLALAELDAPSASLAALQQTLASGLLRISAGQQRSWTLASSDYPRSSEVEAAVAARCGEELATYATLGAQLAGAEPKVVEHYGMVGRALGTGGALASDCRDLFEAGHSHDLANGRRSLPIALHLERLAGHERRRFVRLLEAARRDAAAQEAVRHRLRAAGDLRRSAFAVEVYYQCALRALEQAEPREPVRGGLRAMLAGISFFAGQEAPASPGPLPAAARRSTERTLTNRLHPVHRRERKG